MIGTTWIFKNKLNENGEVVRNRKILVCKGYAQKEGIDYVETFAPMARLEGVRKLLACATCNKFKVYQWMSNLHFQIEQLKKKSTLNN